MFVFVVAWIFSHGLLHGLLDQTWTGYEILIGIALMLWLMMRYYRKRRRSHMNGPTSRAPTREESSVVRRSASISTRIAAIIITLRLN